MEKSSFSLKDSIHVLRLLAIDLALLFRLLGICAFIDSTWSWSDCYTTDQKQGFCSVHSRSTEFVSPLCKMLNTIVTGNYLVIISALVVQILLTWSWVIPFQGYLQIHHIIPSIDELLKKSTSSITGKFCLGCVPHSLVS